MAVPTIPNRELAQFEKFKKMKARLGEIYQEMRLEPGKKNEADSDVQE